MKLNYEEKYEKWIGKYVHLGTNEGNFSGLLKKIEGNDFHFNPTVQSELIKEDSRIFWKKTLENKEFILTINNPRTNLSLTETTEDYLKEYCELSNITEREKSPSYTERRTAGLR